MPVGARGSGSRLVPFLGVVVALVVNVDFLVGIGMRVVSSRELYRLRSQQCGGGGRGYERFERAALQGRVRLERAVELLLRQRLQRAAVEVRLLRQRLQRARLMLRESLERTILAAHLGGVVGDARGGRRTRTGAGGGAGQAVRGGAATALEEVHALVAPPLGSSVGKPNLSVTVNKPD